MRKMMTTVYTEMDFEQLSWHDCHVWGMELRVGDVDDGDWTSDLALDIDFIVEWLCGIGRSIEFRVAPASLIFHGVTDLKVQIDWGDNGTQTALHPLSIDHLEREVITEQKVYLDRSYYRWTIRLNWPAAGVISFGAVDFTQTLWSEPVLTDEQSLSCRERSRLIQAARQRHSG